VLDGGQIDGEANPTSARVVWGDWHGRERDFFRGSARRVNDLTWDEVTAIVGADARVFERLLRNALEGIHSDAIPDRLVLGPFQVVTASRSSVRVVGYSPYDPVDLPKKLMDALPSFDGRRTGDVLRTIERTAGLRLEPDLVRRLVDVGLLIPRD
jgi:hypothetical protein